ncbi:hypothetical protein HAX54_012455 [Datura stramonium]|uniref:Uncharacterized protein n=1 Tax=Datura stramonium TaxID=4076 RepID=A0ABS8TJT6_DATST|nr:hypothetical protein [Datura stramonium]
MAAISDISHATAVDINDDNVHHILSCPCLTSNKLSDSSLSSGCSETISLLKRCQHIYQHKSGSNCHCTTTDNRAVSNHCLFRCKGPRTEFDLFYPSLCLLMQVGELTGLVIGAVVTVNSILAGYAK